MGWIFNTIVAANITGEATHRRATCGNASNPCTIKAVSVIGVARSTSCRGRYIGESPSSGEGFGAGQSRPVVASLALAAGECVAVKGPSGAGKTLLLRAIADLDPNQGLVSLHKPGTS